METLSKRLHVTAISEPHARVGSGYSRAYYEHCLEEVELNLNSALAHNDLSRNNLKVISPKRRFRSRLKLKWKWKWRPDWKFGLYAGLFVSILALIGTASVIFLGRFSHGGFKDGIATIAVGSSTYIHRLSTWYHVLINVVSTILLISSNYAMQTLSAPTRDEIDRAHERGQWLEVGLMSLHNVRCIAKKRVILWGILALSSIPLHLVYDTLSTLVSNCRANSHGCIGTTRPFSR